MSVMLLEMLGLLMIVAGSVVLLRAIATVRADVVAKIVGVALDPGLAAEQASQRRRRRRSGTDTGGIGSRSTGADVFRVKSFEEEVAALNDQMGPKDK